MTTTEAAKILGITGSGVKNMMKRGLLHDISKKTGRHKFKLAAAEVRLFARTYKPRIRSILRDINIPVVLNGAKLISTEHPVTRLERIEAKLDKLIRMWS